MTRPGPLRRARAHLAALLTAPGTTPNVEDHTMTNTQQAAPAADAPPADAPGVPVADRIAAVDSELAKVDAQTTADPVTADGLDLDRWRARDSRRRERSAELVQRRRDLQEYGSLLDAHDGPIRSFLAVVAELRHTYAEVGRVRNYGGRNTPPPEHQNARRDLTRWVEALGALGRALPTGDDDARRYLLGQWRLWFAARDGWCRALLGLDRGLIPAPEVGEDGELPAGLAFGVYLLDDPAARQVHRQGTGGGRVQSFHEYLTDPTQDPDGGPRHQGRVIR